MTPGNIKSGGSHIVGEGVEEICLLNASKDVQGLVFLGVVNVGAKAGAGGWRNALGCDGPPCWRV